MNEAKVFLDTNVLVYAHDTSAGTKHNVARQIVSDLWRNRNGTLSTQVVQEFFVIVTRKTPKPIEISSAQAVIKDLLNWEIVINDGESILGAIGYMKRFNFSFWDALVVHAALQSGAATLMSEDLSYGQRIQEMKIENPFR